MKTWQNVLFMCLGILIILAFLYFVPATSHLVRGLLMIFKFIWFVIAGILVLIIILGSSPLFGFLLKAFGVAYIDSILEKGKVVSYPMHLGFAVVFGLVFGFIESFSMPVFMSWNTWVRSVAMDFGWSGVYETLPLVWFFYGLVVFALAYLYSPYMIVQPGSNRRKDDY